MNQTEKEQFFEEEARVIGEPFKGLVFKCKPCYQFQTIEFDFVTYRFDDLEAMKGLYKKCLEILMEIAPEQQKKVPEALATEKQRQIMKINDIPFTAQTTAKEAQTLIEESIKRANNR